MKNFRYYIPFLSDVDILDQFMIRRSSVLTFIRSIEKELDNTRFLSVAEFRYSRLMDLQDHLTQLYDEIYDLDSIIRLFKTDYPLVISLFDTDHDLIQEDRYINSCDSALRLFLKYNARPGCFHHCSYLMSNDDVFGDSSVSTWYIEFIQY